eukprot:gene2361-6093_t
MPPSLVAPPEPHERSPMRARPQIRLEWDTRDLPARALGGVLLTLKEGSLEHGSIACDNTLASRLATCLEEYAPVLRHELFLREAPQA